MTSRPGGRRRTGFGTAVDLAVIDDHRLRAEAISAGLRQRGISAQAMDPEPVSRLVPMLRAARARLVLLDLDVGAPGDAARMIEVVTRAGIKVLVIDDARDRVRLAEALAAGAVGYCLKSAGLARLMSDVSVALGGGRLLGTAERAALLAELAEARAVRARDLAPFLLLTARERTALKALGDGMTVTEIAREWTVSEATVRTHIRRVLVKLGAQSQLGAVTSAFRHGWLRPGAAVADAHRQVV